MPKSTLEKLSFICLMSTAVPSAHALTTALNAAKSVDLFQRQDQQTCGGVADLEQCGNGLPSDFCCSTGSTCNKLNAAGATSVLCCSPGSQGCQAIQPITCDIQQQNATAFPSNQVHLSDLSIELPKCGKACCPLGFQCQDNVCVVIPSPTGSASLTSSPTSNPTNTADSRPTAIPLEAGSEQKCNAFPGGAVAAGFFPGMILGILITLAMLWGIKKRRQSLSSARSSSNFGPVSRQISDPIYDPAYAARVDFIRRGTTSTKTSTGDTNTLINSTNYSRPRDTIIRTPKVRSLFSRSPKVQQDSPLPPPSVNFTSKPSRRSLKQRSSLARNGSSETIDVLMPTPSFLQVPGPSAAGGGRPMTRDTTFTNLMEDAGWTRQSRDGVRQLSSNHVPQVGKI